ncbi:MAG: hypothetical protein WC947_07860 [Elusimicrobiota bacterium]
MGNTKLPDFDLLARLQTFDPKAFVSDDKKEQEVCCFVLSLALIYNDFKDLVWARHHLIKLKPDNPKEISPGNGQYFGFLNHLEKFHYSLFNELFATIEKNHNVLSHPIFIKVYGLLPKSVKTCWDSLVNISTGKDSKNNLLKSIFERVRNKITYHSDIKDIFSGYREFFLSNRNNMKEHREFAYISRGKNLASNRFYFADATVEGYLIAKIGSNKEEFFKGVNQLLDDVNSSLYHIVVNFVMVRGCSFRDV